MLSDPVRRREALRIGLESLRLPETQIRSAIQLWDQAYAPVKPAALSEYVKELAGQLGYSLEERHQLRVALYVAIARHDGRIVPAAPPPLPSASSAAGASGLNGQASLPTRPAGSPAFVVFNAMAGRILAAVQRDGRTAMEDFAEALEQHANAQRLPVELGVTLNRWARQDAALDQLAHQTASGFAPAMHAIYAAAAEAIGPIEADRQLARAATEAEALPEARQFDPRRLL